MSAGLFYLSQPLLLISTYRPIIYSYTPSITTKPKALRTQIYSSPANQPSSRCKTHCSTSHIPHQRSWKRYVARCAARITHQLKDTPKDPLDFLQQNLLRWFLSVFRLIHKTLRKQTPTVTRRRHCFTNTSITFRCPLYTDTHESHT